MDCNVPQGSVLEPRCFLSYTEDIAVLLEEHAVQSHLYADDIQFHDSCRPDDTDTLRSRLSCCADDINSCCKSCRLQLNADKTEAIWVGSRSNLAKIANSDGSIQVGSSNIQPSTVVRDLGLHLDSELSMKHHVTKVAAACYYHLRRLRQIRPCMGQEVATLWCSQWSFHDWTTATQHWPVCHRQLSHLYNGYRTRRLA